MDNAQFIAEISKIKPSATFLTLRGYRSESSEVSDVSVCFHISYKSALQKSIVKLESLSLKTDLEKQAQEELLTSFRKSLDKVDNEPIEERNDAFIHFFTDDGKAVKGVKIHKETGELFLYGLVVAKRIRMPGNYAKRNSSALTQTKNKLRSICAVGKFRTWKITADKVDSISVENLSLLPPNVED